VESWIEHVRVQIQVTKEEVQMKQSWFCWCLRWHGRGRLPPEVKEVQTGHRYADALSQQLTGSNCAVREFTKANPNIKSRRRCSAWESAFKTRRAANELAMYMIHFQAGDR